MPASFSTFASGWRTLGLVVALPASLAVFSPVAFAADVLVVTDSHHPVKTMGGERLIELDEARRIEAELSAELPAAPEQAAATVKRRLSQGGADLQRRIASAYQGVTDLPGNQAILRGLQVQHGRRYFSQLCRSV